MINRIIGLTVLMLLFACKVKNEATKVQETPKPYWVESRPLNSLDYIGIGVAQKQAGVNFIETAKNNALSDLASEIKVNLQSNTVYKQTEIEGIVNDDFKSTIKTSAEADIEGYEMAGSWQNEKEYWVFYKLSKADYLKRVEEKRIKAKNTSLEHLQTAKESQENGDIKLAVQQYFDAFSAIQAYPPNSIVIDSNEGSDFLDNVIYANIQELFSNIQIKKLEEAIRLDFSNRFSRHALIELTFKGKPAKELPIVYEYYNQYGAVAQSDFTNEQGILDIVVKVQSLQAKRIQNNIYVDIDKLIGNRKDAVFLKQKSAALTPPRFTITAEIIAPKVFVSNEELIFGANTTKDLLKSIVVSELAKEGIFIVDKAEKADLLMKIKSDTKLLNKDTNFTSVGLSYSILITETDSKKTILSLDEGPLKGVSLDEPRAADKAYEKAESQLKRIGMTKIKASILDF